MPLGGTMNYQQEVYSASAVTGEGKSLAQTAQSGNMTPSQGTGVAGSGEQNVFGAWLMVAAVLIGLTLLAEHFSTNQTYGQVKIGFYNMIVITIYAVLGITLGKVFFAKVKVPGISTLFLSA